MRTSFGSVEIPQEPFITALKMADEQDRMARLTSPLRGEVGAPGRAKRDPGKPDEEDFSFVPHRTSRLRQRARPAPFGWPRPLSPRPSWPGSTRPPSRTFIGAAHLAPPGRGRRARSSAARPRQAG